MVSDEAAFTQSEVLDDTSHQSALGDVEESQGYQS